jgi:hypothetical protein
MIKVFTLSTFHTRNSQIRTKHASLCSPKTVTFRIVRNTMLDNKES